MTWQGAYTLARQLAAEKQYKWYVRGYRASSGLWRYAAHSTPPLHFDRNPTYPAHRALS